jgi:hypothetical protein
VDRHRDQVFVPEHFARPSDPPRDGYGSVSARVTASERWRCKGPRPSRIEPARGYGVVEWPGVCPYFEVHCAIEARGISIKGWRLKSSSATRRC